MPTHTTTSADEAVCSDVQLGNDPSSRQGANADLTGVGEWATPPT